MTENDADLTVLLAKVTSGEPGAVDQLAQVVRARLREMAARRLEREFGRDQPGRTIQPTVLANDTFMRLIRQRNKFDSSGHFFAIASQEMLRVLIDYRRRIWNKPKFVSLDPKIHNPTQKDEADLEAFDAVLKRLAALDQRKADVVTYRVLWEFTIDETAKSLGVGHATVERDWAFAKAWLKTELEESSS